MLEKLLPQEIAKIIEQRVGVRAINEIRIRAGQPILLNLGSGKVYLSEDGTTTSEKNAIIATSIMIEDLVFRASECSIYSVNEQIKRGYVMVSGGVRIGLGGNLIIEKGEVKTMTNFSSVNIRLPHRVNGCSLCAYDDIITDKQIYNTLIISPPSCGKTTFLRDLIFETCERCYAYDMLVIDERGELDLDNNLGKFVDKISFSDKKTAFENGIRALSPEVIFTDEIGGREDIEAIDFATKCGVSIIATIHAKDLFELQAKSELRSILKDKVFKRFVVLSKHKGAGTFEGMYNENFSRVR